MDQMIVPCEALQKDALTTEADGITGLMTPVTGDRTGIESDVAKLNSCQLPVTSGFNIDFVCS